MDEEGMRYDSDAIENVQALLISANSNLTLANDSYTSDALTGSNLVEEVKEFIEEFRKRLLYAYSAIGNINDEDAFLGFDSLISLDNQEYDDYLQVLFALHEMNQLTEEAEDTYEWEMATNFYIEDLYHSGLLTNGIIDKYDKNIDQEAANFDFVMTTFRDYRDEKQKEVDGFDPDYLVQENNLYRDYTGEVLTPEDYQSALYR